MVRFENPGELGQKVALRQSAVEPERDVLEHRQCLEQREMLKNHADAESASGARIGDAHRRAVEQDLAFVGRDDAVDHLDEGRFPAPFSPSNA